MASRAAFQMLAFAVATAPLAPPNSLHTSDLLHTNALKMNQPHGEDREGQVEGQVESAEVFKENSPQRKFSLIESDVEISPVVNHDQGSPAPGQTSPFKSFGNSQSPLKNQVNIIGDSQSPLKIAANPLRIQNLAEVIRGAGTSEDEDDDLHRHDFRPQRFAGVADDFKIEDHLSRISNKLLNNGGRLSYMDDDYSRTGPVTRPLTNNSKLQSIPSRVPTIPGVQNLLGVTGPALHSVHTPHAPQTSIFSNPMIPITNPLLNPHLQKTATNRLLRTRLLLGNQFTNGQFTAGNCGIQEPAIANMTYTLNGINGTLNDEQDELSEETFVRHADEEGEEDLESRRVGNEGEHDEEHNDRNDHVENEQPEVPQQRNFRSEASNEVGNSRIAEEEQRLQRDREIQNPAHSEHDRSLSEESENVEEATEPREHAGKLGKLSTIQSDDVEEPKEPAGKLGKMSMMMMPAESGVMPAESGKLQKMTELRNETLSARATGKLQKMTEHRNETLNLRATGKLQGMIKARDEARAQERNESLNLQNKESGGAKRSKQGKTKAPKFGSSRVRRSQRKANQTILRALHKQTVKPQKNPHKKREAKQMSKQISKPISKGLTNSGVQAVKRVSEVSRIRADSKKSDSEHPIGRVAYPLAFDKGEPFRAMDGKLLPRKSALEGREAIKGVVDVLRKKPQDYSDDEGKIPVKVPATRGTNPDAPQPGTPQLAPNHPPNPAQDDVSIISLLPSLTVSLNGDNESNHEPDGSAHDNLDVVAKQEEEESDGSEQELESSPAGNSEISRLNRRIRTLEREIVAMEAAKGGNGASDSSSILEDQEADQEQQSQELSDHDESSSAMQASQNAIGQSLSEARSKSSMEHEDGSSLEPDDRGEGPASKSKSLIKRFECIKGCKRRFAFKSGMTRHAKDCTGVSVEAAKQIEALLNLDKFSFVCNKADLNTGKDCGKRFSSQRDLDQHQKFPCDDEFPWKCDHEGCNHEFRTQVALRDHQFRKHAGTVTKRKYKKNQRSRTLKEAAIRTQQADQASDRDAESSSDDLKCRELFYACLVPTPGEQQISSDEDEEIERISKEAEILKEGGILKGGLGHTVNCTKQERVNNVNINKVKSIPLQIRDSTTISAAKSDQDSAATRKPANNNSTASRKPVTSTFICPRPHCVRRVIREPYLCPEGEFMFPESDCRDGKCSWQDLMCDYSAWWSETRAEMRPETRSETRGSETREVKRTPESDSLSGSKK